MKTLDEVIERIEDDLHAAEADSQLIMLFDRDVVDALHYLKEYRSKQGTIAEQLAELEQKNDHVCELAKTVCEEYDRLCNRLAEEYRNPSLTWDELKGMEGKPVFVEERYRNGDLKSSGWWLIDFWNDDQICLRDQGGNPWNAHRESIGRDWQAYRKERTDEKP